MGRRDIPQRASTAWGKTAAVGARTARGRELIAILAESRRQAAARRDRVLRHDWATKRLCVIFGYKQATQWSGYVPPRSDPADDHGPQLSRPNTSPHRAALVQLLRDIKQFEDTGELPAYATSPTEEGEAE